MTTPAAPAATTDDRFERRDENARAAARRLAAEALGTGSLVAAVVGSGIMGTALTADVGLALLINALSTVTALGVLIWTLGPTSGAHFNPAVTLVAAARREIGAPEAGAYLLAQCSGAILGVAVANLMFAAPAWAPSTTTRTGAGLLLGEIVATAGLIWVIGALTRSGRGNLGPLLVPAWIGAAYFFTSSTSFANPAVTLGRMLTDTFTGIASGSVLAFVAAQLVGAVVGGVLVEVFHPRHGVVPEPLDLPSPVHPPAGEPEHATSDPRHRSAGARR